MPVKPRTVSLFQLAREEEDGFVLEPDLYSRLSFALERARNRNADPKSDQRWVVLITDALLVDPDEAEDDC